MRVKRFETVDLQEVKDLLEDYVELVSTDDDCMVRIKKLLSDIDVKKRTAFILVVEGKTSRAIGEFLGVSHMTVMRWYNEVKERLHESVKGVSYDNRVDYE